jgi:hypothetical protein
LRGAGAELSYPPQKEDFAGVLMTLQRPESVILIDVDEAGQL